MMETATTPPFLVPIGQSEFELAALEYFIETSLNGDLLRQHASMASRERDITGVGFYLNFSVPRHLEKLPIRRPLEIAIFEAVELSFGGSLLLWVDEHGYLDSLECACNGDAWPEKKITLKKIFRDPNKAKDLQ